MGEQIHQSTNPLKDALALITAANINRISGLRIAKGFMNIGEPFIGFEGKDSDEKYFQLRVDYDPEKQGHVNVMINDREKHAFVGETYNWCIQVVNNMNGGSYCNVERNSRNEWQTRDQTKNPGYIEGMKKYMKRSL